MKKVIGGKDIDEIIRQTKNPDFKTPMSNLPAKASTAPKNAEANESTLLREELVAPIRSVRGKRTKGMNAHSDLLCVELMNEDGRLPTRGSANAAGFDIYASEPYIIAPWSRQLVNTKIKVALPMGCYARIAPRSGLALQGIDVAAGVIDRDYLGEVGVILVNASDSPFTVVKGARIAQLILEQYVHTSVFKVGSVADIVGFTDRGDGGFGSTGN
jgi:dUTP pyrophosphatase